ncbi:MAG: two-component sensor histidine kinase [Propionibacteriales bacterium]|nr:two-component sensor histidine kinase [Propionibacteriales bacterium]
MPNPFTRAVFLLLGSALALSFMLLDVTLVALLDQAGSRLAWTVAAATAIVLVPPVLLGLIPAVRQVEAVAAETLLGVDFPEGTPGPAKDWAQLRRSATWFLLHVLAGAVVAAVVVLLSTLTVSLVLAPFTRDAGDQVMSVGWLRVRGGWADAWMPPAGLLVLAVMLALPPWLGALMARLAPTLLGPSYAERLRRLEDQTARQVERNRIAREIHDSVGHALSLVTLQAAAARRVLQRDPEFAAGALDAIESASRAATGDLDHMLGLLRDSGEPSTETGAETRAPTPDLAALPALLSATRSAGLDVDALVDADLSGIPLLVSRETYRIVQEGLTNALRYAGTASARLQISRPPGELAVELTNPIGRERGRGRGGRGLSGIEERAAALGGQMTCTMDEQTWRLSVVLPLPATGELSG